MENDVDRSITTRSIKGAHRKTWEEKVVLDVEYSYVRPREMAVLLLGESNRGDSFGIFLIHLSRCLRLFHEFSSRKGDEGRGEPLIHRVRRVN